MKQSTLPIKGTKEYLPQEMLIRNYIKESILQIYLSNGFKSIGTPILEDVNRLSNSDGGENLNMIFKILKRGEKLQRSINESGENDLVDYALRYDLTLPLARFYANNQNFLPSPFKCVQIGEVFRAERPQKGRLREFTQCDIDIIGDESINAETELIYVTAKALNKLGFNDFCIKINDRRILLSVIENIGFNADEISQVCIALDKLDKVGISGVENDLLSKGFNENKIKAIVKFISDAEGNSLEAASKYCRDDNILQNINEIISSIRELSSGYYSIEYDIALVRGMGYYTGTIFEITSPSFTSSIAGGGRYDKMIGKFIKNEIPAVGFSIGFERIYSLLLDMKTTMDKINAKNIVLLYETETPFFKVIKKADVLKDEYCCSVLTAQKTKNLKKQIDKIIENNKNTSIYIYESNKFMDFK